MYIHIIHVYITPPYPERIEAVDTVIEKMHCSQHPRCGRAGLS
jgi:hypothetical protein